MPNGYNSSGDLVTKTADGRDLNSIWDEYQTVLDIANGERNLLIDFLTYQVTAPIFSVPIIGSGGDFEEATEYGRPAGSRPPVTTLDRGFNFKWYDRGLKYTWKMLSQSTAAQLQSGLNTILEESNRLVFKRVFNQLFRNTAQTFSLDGVQGQATYTAFSFYNGDSEVPPKYRTTTFASAHDHFVTNAATAITPTILEALMLKVTEHGYTRQNGYRLVVIGNPTTMAPIRAFRAGTASATYDFIPATGTPGVIITPGTLLLNGQVSNDMDGLDRLGTYGDWNVLQDDYFPAGYVFVFATGGRDNLTNPIGYRQHADAGLRGLQLVQDQAKNYPLIDSYYVQGLGTGVSQRGAGAMLQLNNAGAYTLPTDYAV